MNMRRLPIVLSALGLIFKTFLVLLWRHGRSPGLLNLLTNYDPGARYFAERMTRLFFDYGGITMAQGAPTSYEVFLIIGFGTECFVLGFIVQWVLRRFGGSRSAPPMPTTP